MIAVFTHNHLSKAYRYLLSISTDLRHCDVIVWLDDVETQSQKLRIRQRFLFRCLCRRFVVCADNSGAEEGGGSAGRVDGTAATSSPLVAVLSRDLVDSAHREMQQNCTRCGTDFKKKMKNFTENEMILNGRFGSPVSLTENSHFIVIDFG